MPVARHLLIEGGEHMRPGFVEAEELTRGNGAYGDRCQVGRCRLGYRDLSAFCLMAAVCISHLPVARETPDKRDEMEWTAERGKSRDLGVESGFACAPTPGILNCGGDRRQDECGRLGPLLSLLLIPWGRSGKLVSGSVWSSKKVPSFIPPSADQPGGI